MIFSKNRRKRCTHTIEVVETRSHIHIPAEIVEQILLNLPVKSLLRFSSASKSWNSIIHQPCFIKKYRGNERIIFSNLDSLSLSTIFSDNSIEKATKLVCPFYPSDRPLSSLKIKAFCYGLLCVQDFTKNSFFLWNPSIQSYRQLPNPLLLNRESPNIRYFYGLGYDAVGDDYKLLKISYGGEVKLYSLRSNSWRKIQSFPMSTRKKLWSCFVRGTLHWLCKAMSDNYYYTIVSFELSTEEYGEVALPPDYPYSSLSAYIFDKVDVTVLMGKLCLFVDHWEKQRLVLWVMEEYGVVESWTKKLDFEYSSNISGFGNVHRLRPLYMCKNGKIVIYVTTNLGGESGVILVNENGETLVRRSFGRRRVNGGGLVFVESLVSPATWPS